MMDQTYGKVTPNLSLGNEDTAIVFFRASNFVGAAVSAYIFESNGRKGVKFVGALPNGKKILFVTTPGKHAFASRSQSMFGCRRSFLLESELLASKIYYIEVSLGSLWPVVNPLQREIENKIKACDWEQDLEIDRKWFNQNESLFCTEFQHIEALTSKEKIQNPTNEATRGFSFSEYMVLPSYGIDRII